MTTASLNIEELKTRVISQIEEADFKLLKIIAAMVDAYEEEDPIIGYNTQGEPQYASVKVKQYMKDIEAAKAGNFFTIDELENEEEWSDLIK